MPHTPCNNCVFLQDKLLRKEAEYVEMDIQHKQNLQTMTEQVIDRDQRIRQLKRDLMQQKALPVSLLRCS